MTTSPKSLQRSWTANDEPGTSKWLPITLLSIALIASLYYFLAYAFGKPEPNTFALSVTVSRYSDQVRLPQPAFTHWDLEELVESFAIRGLQPWKTLEPRLLDLKSKFDTAAIQQELLKGDLQSIDTLLVYVRGHALAINGEAYLLTGDFANTEILGPGPIQQLDRAEKLSELFQRLQQLPVGNVIVLADIGDWPSLPQLGVMANNTPELIGQALGELTADKPLWVLTATASLQTNHISEVRRRTLLQSASEYALDARHATKEVKRNRFLSLTKFYEAVLRYSHDVTNASQTPLLFRSGSPLRLDTDHPAWSEAGVVRVARRAAERLMNSESTGGDAEVDSKRDSTNDTASRDQRVVRQTQRLVSTTQVPSNSSEANRGNSALGNPATTSPATSNIPATTPSSTPPANVSADPLVPAVSEELTPHLRFWQLRDRLLSRTKHAQGWSPIDFAVMPWRDAELTASSLERSLRLTSQNANAEIRKTNEDIARLVAPFEQLEDLFRTQQMSSAADNSLLSGWNTLQTQVDIKQSPGLGKHPWANPLALPTEIAQPWLPIRQGYRDYMDAVSQLPSWLNAAAADSQLLPALEQLIDALVKLDPQLPSAATHTALARPLADSSLSEVTNGLAKLKTELKQHLQALRERLEGAILPGGTAITWTEERRVQELLNGTCLTYEDRKQLAAAYIRLSVQHVRQPGARNYSLDTKIELNSLLQNASSQDALAQRGRWCTVLRKSLTLTNPPEIPSVPSSVSQLNAWGRELLISKRSETVGDGNPARQFKQACLNEFRPWSPASGLGAGPILLIPVSNDTALHVVLPSQLQLPNELVLSVKLRNAAPINSCYVKWRLSNADAFAAVGDQPLQVAGNREETLLPEVFHPLAVSGGQIALRFATELNSLNTPAPLKIELAIARDSVGTDASLHQVEVSPPNPNRIELYATSLNPIAGEPRVTRSELVEVEESQYSILSGISVPAVNQQAKSGYELHLFNLSDEAKVVRAALYAVEPGSGQIVGNGSLSKKAMANTERRYKEGDLQPQFISGPIPLSANQQGIVAYDAQRVPNDSQKIVLQPFVAEGVVAGDGSTGPRNMGEYGLLCVLEEVVIEADNQIRVLKDKQTLHWITCECANPRAGLALAELIPQADMFILRVEVPRANWRRWDLKELKLNAQLTNMQGTAVDFEGSPVAVLNEENNKLDMRITPVVRNTLPYVVHVDIGGYPRAINFQSRLGGLPDDARGTNQAFVWLDPRSLICTDSQGKPLTLGRLTANAVVIPAREGVSGESDGTPIAVENIAIPVPMDFEGGSRAKIAIDTLPQTYDWDRKAFPQFVLKGGNLVFSSAVEDLTHSFSPQEFRFAGRKRLEAFVLNEPQSAKSFDLLFDRQLPEQATVEISHPELYLDGPIELAIAVSDDSDIAAVYFAVDKENSGAGKYDNGDMLKREARLDGGRWVATLDAETIAQAPAAERLLAGKTYVVVCRAVDLAGNIQDKHTPERFRWTNQKRPVEVPLPKPKPKPTTPPPPPEPTERTVFVDITVEGQLPPYPKKTAISGIEGALEKNVGGSWMITQVPDGPYEITATYTDAFGVEFEGKGKLNVSPTAQRIAIDVKRKK